MQRESEVNATTTLKDIIVRTAAVLMIGLATPMAMAGDRGRPIEVTVDVSEDFTKFVPAPPIVDTIPQRGSFFITEGSIYPAGTIKGDGATFDPTDAAGPKAAGRWFCSGTHLVAGNEIPATTQPWVYTSQLYLLPDDRSSIETSGLEQTAPITRAVTSGTGKFKRFAGIQKQEFLGFNKLGGVNLRVTFILHKDD